MLEILIGGAGTIFFEVLKKIINLMLLIGTACLKTFQFALFLNYIDFSIFLKAHFSYLTFA